MNRQPSFEKPNAVPVGTGRGAVLQPDPKAWPDRQRPKPGEPVWKNHWKLCKYL